MFEIGDLVKVKDEYLSMYKEYKGKKRIIIRMSGESEKVKLYALDDWGIKDSIPFFEREIEKVD